MSASQFWATFLAAALVAAAVVLVRRSQRRPGPGALERVRQLLEFQRGPVDLDVLPRILADRALAAAVPAPGGRVMPLRFRLRCGPATNDAVYRVRDELFTEFRRRCVEVARRQGWPPIEPFVVVELDDDLPPTAYRFEAVASPHRGPGRRSTDLLPQPTVPRACPTHPSWTVHVRGARPVPVDGVLTVGADRTCSIVVDDRFVSKVHVMLSVRDGDLVVRDGGPDGSASTNGTTVDGRPVRSVVVLAEVGEAVVGFGMDARRTDLTLRVVHRAEGPGGGR